MGIKTILAARGKPTGQSWAFLGFKDPSGGEQIIHPPLSSLIASQPRLTGAEYSSCKLAAPKHECWIRVGARCYRPISDDLSEPPAALHPRTLCTSPCWTGDIMEAGMFSPADKGTPPDHDTWLSRPPPQPMRKRSIAQIFLYIRNQISECIQLGKCSALVRHSTLRS